MAVSATIPNRAIPIASLTFGGQRYDMPLNEEWARFFRDIQIRSGGVTGVMPATSGGTGFSSYTVGDMLYADTVSSLARLNITASGNALLSGAAPSWGKIGLTSHVSGILPEANGGTGFTAFGGGVATFLQTPTSANLAAALTDETGTGPAVFAETPTLVTPNLGTPNSGTLTNCTGLPVSTGISGLAAGVAAFLATPSSANLATAVTDETGTGALVFANTPTFVTPILGTPTSGNLANCTGYPTSALTGTVTVAQGGTGITSGTSGGVPYYSSSSTIASSAALAANALVLGGGAGTAPATLGSLGTTTTVLHGNAAGAPTFGAVSLTADVTGTLPVANGGTGITSFGAGVATWLGTPSSANLASAVTDETGSGALVFANTPTLVTPVIGAATGTSVNLSSTATASAFIPSGSSVPTNGLYLPAANRISLSTHITERLRIDSSGNFLPFTVGVFGSAGNPWGAIYSSGNVRCGSLSVAEGSNAKQGTATLVAGTVTVANTSVTANSRIFLTSQVDGGTPGFLRVSARVAATSFTITSSNGADTSTVAYLITEPG